METDERCTHPLCVMTFILHNTSHLKVTKRKVLRGKIMNSISSRSEVLTSMIRTVVSWKVKGVICIQIWVFGLLHPVVRSDGSDGLSKCQQLFYSGTLPRTLHSSTWRLWKSQIPYNFDEFTDISEISSFWILSYIQIKDKINICRMENYSLLLI